MAGTCSILWSQCAVRAIVDTLAVGVNSHVWCFAVGEATPSGFNFLLRHFVFGRQLGWIMISMCKDSTDSQRRLPRLVLLLVQRIDEGSKGTAYAVWSNRLVSGTWYDASRGLDLLTCSVGFRAFSLLNCIRQFACTRDQGDELLCACTGATTH